MHTPVLIKQIVQNLLKHQSPAKQLTIIDATFGGGGYTKSILKIFPNSTILAFDRDLAAIARAREFGPRVIPIHAQFSSMKEKITELGIEKVDAVILDIGLVCTIK
jgi:16S rRNA (cytosine1402-N4)-methyltransferase